jgi:tetratricopeptide (TPR) repeat protein
MTSVDVTAKFEIPDGEKVSDTTVIVAKVQDPDEVGIDKVEFYLDDKLVATDTSTPYTFDWDTLAGDEGRHTVSAIVFDSKGKTAKIKATYVVDNELDKGADAHADTALGALKDGKIDLAAKYARRSLKIEPKNVKAARALCGIYRHSGDLEKALAVVKDLEIPPGEIALRREIIALHIAMADASDGSEAYLEHAAKAVAVQEELSKALVAASKDTPLERGDALGGVGRWAEALASYDRAGTPGEAPPAAVNRQILALIHLNKLSDAGEILNQLQRAKKGDDTTKLLRGYHLLASHRLDEALPILDEQAQKGAPAALVLAAYANMAAKKTAEARRLAEEAASVGSTMPEALLVSAYFLADPSDAAKQASRALAADPSRAEPYVYRGYQALLGRDPKRFQIADSWFQFALKRDPNNGQALLATALCYMAQNRNNEAEPLLAQLIKQEPKAPDALVAASTNDLILQKTAKVNAYLEQARKSDPTRWPDSIPPKLTDLLGRAFRYRFSPNISPQTLFPAENP